MSNSVFVHLEFWLLVVFSLVVPTAIYTGLLYKRAISRVTVLVLGIVLVLVSALDVVLLQRLEREAKITPSIADDHLFISEVTLALYLLPLIFAGIGINMMSHVLIEHLSEAERKWDEEQPRHRPRIRLRFRPPSRRDGG
ncbi:MAG TPA: hypothetical protein VMZ74_10890 [Ramlibacter sp.]|nr:hypothetical protein [Ramlibacter sp.]